MPKHTDPFAVEATGNWTMYPRMQYSASAPDMKTFDKSVNAARYVAPKYSMRAKVSFGAQIRAKMSESSDTAGPIDISSAKYQPPKYSMRARTCKMLQLPGMTTDSVPGPGAYPIPTTTNFNHPCIMMPRRCTFGSCPRFP